MRVLKRLCQEDPGPFGAEPRVSSFRDVRNKRAHQKAFSTHDAYLAIDSIARWLAAVSAEQVETVEQLKAEILLVKRDEVRTVLVQFPANRF